MEAHEHLSKSWIIEKHCRSGTGLMLCGTHAKDTHASFRLVSQGFKSPDQP